MQVLGGGLENTEFWSTKNSFNIKDHYTLPVGLIINEEHKWRVRACFGIHQATDCGEWSNGGNLWTFTPKLSPPKLIAPKNTTSTSALLLEDPQGNFSIKFEWKKTVGAEKYNIVEDRILG